MWRPGGYCACVKNDGFSGVDGLQENVCTDNLKENGEQAQFSGSGLPHRPDSGASTYATSR